MISFEGYTLLFAMWGKNQNSVIRKKYIDIFQENCNINSRITFSGSEKKSELFDFLSEKPSAESALFRVEFAALKDQFVERSIGGVERCSGKVQRWIRTKEVLKISKSELISAQFLLDVHPDVNFFDTWRGSRNLPESSSGNSNVD